MIRGKKIILFILSFVTISIIHSSIVHADRMPPTPVDAVIYEGLKIMPVNSPDTMGLVEAYDLETNELAWRTQVYQIQIKRWMEADTQWVFIKTMKIENDKLIIVDENNQIYELDPLTGKNLHDNKNGTGVVMNILTVVLVAVIVFLSIFQFRFRDLNHSKNLR